MRMTKQHTGAKGSATAILISAWLAEDNSGLVISNWSLIIFIWNLTDSFMVWYMYVINTC